MKPGEMVLSILLGGVQMFTGAYRRRGWRVTTDLVDGPPLQTDLEAWGDGRLARFPGAHLPHAHVHHEQTQTFFDRQVYDAL
jgi:hypothetical protein